MGEHSQPIDEPLGAPVNYAKLGAAVVATILSAIIAALTGDAVISSTEWINIAIAGVGALAVFSAPNVPGAPVTKTVLAVLSAVLMLLVNLIADGVTISEWMQLGVAALGALGVYVVPNGSDQEATV
jgi:2-keto-3-deoxy-6-phosphogluconate aldolase